MHMHEATNANMRGHCSCITCLQAEFESRCEMYEAQVTKMQRSLERGDTEKAKVEEELAKAMALNAQGDRQVMVAFDFTIPSICIFNVWAQYWLLQLLNQQLTDQHWYLYVSQKTASLFATAMLLVPKRRCMLKHVYLSCRAWPP